MPQTQGLKQALERVPQVHAQGADPQQIHGRTQRLAQTRVHHGCQSIGMAVRQAEIADMHNHEHQHDQPGHQHRTGRNLAIAVALELAVPDRPRFAVAGRLANAQHDVRQKKHGQTDFGHRQQRIGLDRMCVGVERRTALSGQQGQIAG